MSRKTFAQVFVLGLLLLAFLAVPASAQAGGMCGGKYTVDAGDTLNSIASRCGISVSAITTANSGVADPLKTGQTLTLPVGSPSTGSVTSSIVSSDPTYTTTSTTTTVNNTYVAPVVTSNNGTYVVQYGDTFSAIASRYGLSVSQLWAANPQIWNINLVYPGQVIYLTSSGGQTGSYTPISEMEPTSYGNVPAGTTYSDVRLVNKSSGDFYVSIQGSTRDGIRVIYEYPVTKSTRVKITVGSYSYVAWVNEQEFVGYFDLGGISSRTLTFRNDGVTVQ